MTPTDFERLQALVASRAGARLGRDRMSLAGHRLAPVARREGFDGPAALLAALWDRPVASLGWAVIEALLNPETWFRRDRQPFDILANELLPALARARSDRPVTLWSAGCSTGQEAYSLALAAAQAGVEARILATDLSHRAVEKARSGLYTSFEIQRGLSARTMLAGFDAVDDHWRARPELARMIRFERQNLLDGPGQDARFDVIFCRYVLGDMEPARRAQVLETLERSLADDGCLFLAPDDRPEDDTLAFRPVNSRPGLFVKAPAALRRAA